MQRMKPRDEASQLRFTADGDAQAQSIRCGSSMFDRQSLRSRLWPLALLLACCTPARLRTAEEQAEPIAAVASPEAIEQFEKQVRPILVKRCQGCHGPKKQEGGLRLDSRAALLKGGADGAVVVPGSPEKSRLIQAVGYADEDLQMPPDDPLPSSAVAALSEWVRRGAPWPENGTAGPPPPSVAWKSHWAAQPVRAQQLPEVQAASWVVSPVDAFVLAGLERQGLAPSPPADRRTLLRRVTFDLVGLPPSADEIAAFEQDTSPTAFATVVERLLASPHYGERWGRHWLDLAALCRHQRIRSAQGGAAVSVRVYVSRLRHAGDERRPALRPIRNRAVGGRFAAGRRWPAPARGAGISDLGRNFTGNPHDIIDDRIDVVTRTLLGLTVSCARCHDHKYDPIPTADYYSLYGVLASCEVPAVPPLIDAAPPNRPGRHIWPKRKCAKPRSSSSSAGPTARCSTSCEQAREPISPRRSRAAGPI